jgi:arylsulfatase A-like enzyme
MYEESMKTPMLARFPKVIKPGTVYKDLVMNIDIAPTALDLAGLPVPKEIQGQSMLPLFKSKEYKARDAVYYHYYEWGEHSVMPHFGIRTSRYKLIRFYQVEDKWELYDLAKDPREMHNIFGEKKYTKEQAKLMVRLNELVKQYADVEAEKVLTKK